MPRAAVPGDVTFDVTDTGDQLVYYIGEADTSWRELGLTVTGPDGQAVQVKNYLFGTEAVKITTHDHRGDYVMHPDFAVATFRADQTGGYQVATSSASENGAEIAVGENLVGSVVLRLIGALAIVLAGVATCVVLVIVTADRAARRGMLPEPGHVTERGLDGGRLAPASRPPSATVTAARAGKPATSATWSPG